MRGGVAEKLIQWYDPLRRDLPWKHTDDPYKIWLSEIILQQTRVEQGRPYYLKFISAFPTIFDLAEAPLERVLKLWEGLGYYSRARNMHEAAMQVVNEYEGVFPATFNELIRLKGVGTYTASAVASFAYNEPVAVVDGNVFRFLARFFGISESIDTTKGKKLFNVIAQENLDKSRPGIYNQAIMDFGAIVCCPTNPGCLSCPFQPDCAAYKTNRVSLLPVRSKKLIRRDRFLNFIVICSNDQVLIQQRHDNDIWKKLYQFPVIESTGELLNSNAMTDLAPYWLNELLMSSTNKWTSSVFKQVLTHQNIFAQFTFFKNNSLEIMENGQHLTLINKQSLKNHAFPKIINEFLYEFQDMIN